MKQAIPLTVFCKTVAAAMVAFGDHVKPSPSRGIATIPDDKGLPAPFRTELMMDVAKSIHVHLKRDPGRAIRLMTAVTFALNQEAIRMYWALTNELIASGDLHTLWRNARDDDSVYAFAAFFVISGMHVDDPRAFSETISTVLGKSFELSVNRDGWDSELTLALFGPVWQTLYMRHDMSEADYFETILHQRPPLVGRIAPEKPVVLVPYDMGGA